MLTHNYTALDSPNITQNGRFAVSSQLNNVNYN